MIEKFAKRNKAIDLMKIIAVFAVMNSHMEICYGKYDFVATGGAIGDALFFFCSGFMLFNKASIKFSSFMKKRISRIYPAVFITAIIGNLFFYDNKNIVEILCWGGGWFINCIMIYYIFIWHIHRFFKEHLKKIWCINFILIIGWFLFIFGYDNPISIYGYNYLKWLFFFIFMFQGACIGMSPQKHKFSKTTIPLLVICILSWYSIQYLSLILIPLYFLQIFSLLPLLGIVYYTYRLCAYPKLSTIYEKPVMGRIIYITGNLCLECYLIQFYLYTDKLNWIFPLNIPIIMIETLIVSYAIHFLSDIFAQTFSNGDYNWKKALLID